MLVVQPPAAPGTASWTTVMGARVRFLPIDRTMLRRARRAALEALGRDETASELPAHEQLEELGDALSHALLIAGIAEWEGVFSVQADGTSTALDCTPEHKAHVLSDPLIFEAFDAAYVVPFATRERDRAEPGNGCAASPNGTGEAATPAKTIAASAAGRRSGGARRARTGATPPKPTRKRTSGTS